MLLLAPADDIFNVSLFFAFFSPPSECMRYGRLVAVQKSIRLLCSVDCGGPEKRVCSVGGKIL